MCISVVDNLTNAWGPLIFNGVANIGIFASVAVLVASIGVKFFNPDIPFAAFLSDLRLPAGLTALAAVGVLGLITTVGCGALFFGA